MDDIFGVKSGVGGGRLFDIGDMELRGALVDLCAIDEIE